jgi:hypothetical protein
MEPRSYLSETNWKTMLASARRYTSSELPTRLARVQLSMRSCAPCVPPQHHDHDQDAHNAPISVLKARSLSPGATFATRRSGVRVP